MSSSNSGPPSVSTGITVDLLKLVEDFPDYEDPDRVRSDVLELSKHCKTLVPRRGSVGASELLTLHGTFPIYFKGVAYQTPVQIYVKEDYPASAPLCYIVPALGMSLRVGHHSVDQRGVVTLPYLKEWSAGSHNLVGLVESLTAVFGAEPPLFATPGYQAPPPAKTLQGGKVQVVCPSYGRTGTSSMKAALEILGFGPAYHMQSVFANGGVHAQLWLDGFQGRGLDVDKVLEGYKAVTDWPAADLYKEILAANPDAKVVVTQRDPDSWWKSMATTISFENKTYGSWGFFFLQVLDSNFRLMNSMLLHIKTLSMGEEEAKADYARHNKEVLEHVASDKLLEFSVKQGWEPLCEFLGVPVPDAPFPRANSTDEAQAKFKKASRGGWMMMTVALGVAGASVAAATFFGGKRAGGALAATEVVFLTHRVRKAVVMRRGG